MTNSFQIFFENSNRKPNKIWVNESSGFDNRSVKSWLQDNDNYNECIQHTMKESLLLLKDLLEP